MTLFSMEGVPLLTRCRRLNSTAYWTWTPAIPPACARACNTPAYRAFSQSIEAFIREPVSFPILDDESLPRALVGLQQVLGELTDFFGLPGHHVGNEGTPRMGRIRPGAPGAEAQRHEDVGLEGHLEHLPESGCFGEIGERVDRSRSEILSGIIIRRVARRDRQRDN